MGDVEVSRCEFLLWERGERGSHWERLLGRVMSRVRESKVVGSMCVRRESSESQRDVLLVARGVCV